MSPTGRYQSRFLNFLSQQSQRLSDQVGRVTRQFQVAALWSAQVILYPLYLIFQGTRLVGQQLKEAIRQGIPQIRAAQDLDFQKPVTSDQPIWRVLSALQKSPGFQLEGYQLRVPSLVDQPKLTGESSFPLTVASQPGTIAVTESATIAGSPSSGQSKGTTTFVKDSPGSSLGFLDLQGVASLVENRSLVLVDEQNQIWDVLTVEQQKYLYQRIIWELIDYYRSFKLMKLLGQGHSLPSPQKMPLPLPAKLPAALLPLQKVQDLMAWLQQGSVAMSINLFGEAELAGLLDLQREFFPQGWFQLSGTELQLLPPSEIPLQQLAFPPIEGRLLDVLANWSLQTTQTGLSNANLPATDSWLSLEDLFGNEPTIVANVAITPPEAPTVEDPWLSMEDLFGEKPETIVQPITEMIQPLGQPVAWTIPVPPAPAEIGSSVELTSPLPNLAPPRKDLDEPMDEPGNEAGSGQAAQIVTATPGEVFIASQAAHLISNIRNHLQAIHTSSPPEDEGNASDVIPDERLEMPSTDSFSQSPVLPPEDDRLTPQLPSTSTHYRAGALTHRGNQPAGSQSKSAGLKHTPDWIETDAKTTGYVKHPLEHIMEWLDRAILWLEEVGILVWQSIRRLWRG